MTTEIDIQLVRDCYQKMTDEELIRVVRKGVSDLTQEAQDVVNEEVKRRNLDTNPANYLDDEQSINQQTVATANNNKSFEFALLFALLFGPFGLLYVSITNGIILIILGLVGIFTLGYVGLIIVWTISVILAITATSNSNNKTSTRTTISNSDNRESFLNQLSQLHSLKEKNVITDEIYEQERRKILAKLDKET